MTREARNIDQRIVDHFAQDAFPKDATLMCIEPCRLPAKSGGCQESGQPVGQGDDNGRQPRALAACKLLRVVFGGQ